MTIAVAAMLVSGSAQAQTQNAAAPAQAQATQPAKKAPKSKKAQKPAGERVCKLLSQGKVCLTADQWKAYEEIM